MQWTQCIGYPKYISNNARLKYMQFNYLHHTYLTPHRLARMFSTSTDACPRCLSADATFPHMVWACPQLGTYWNGIAEILVEAAGTLVAPQAPHFIVSITKHNACHKNLNRFLDLEPDFAKRKLAMTWKSSMGPSMHTWLLDLRRTLVAEQETQLTNATRLPPSANPTPWRGYLTAIELKLLATSPDPS